MINGLKSKLQQIKTKTIPIFVPQFLKSTKWQGY